jgi:hypothetical protein
MKRAIIDKGHENTCTFLVGKVMSYILYLNDYINI